ncbi:PAS domain-containing protein [Streptomyces sp. IBSBF 2435]|uniref:PAS domain-containing protein n=1 Tax=Streptomyces sp. IBSBF 2435 TaxID=2903531 RepID=UPI003FA7C8FE
METGQVPEPLFTADDAGRVSSWSQAAASLFGRSADDVVGGPAAEAVGGADAALRVVPRSGGGWGRRAVGRGCVSLDHVRPQLGRGEPTACGARP